MTGMHKTHLPADGPPVDIRLPFVVCVLLHTSSKISKYVMDLVHVVVESSGQLLEWNEVRLLPAILN